MKKIIEGKKYDTETAKKVGENGYGDYGDYKFVYKSLYRKKNGEFFLHCEGGAGTQFAKKVGTNAWQQGEIIEPMSYTEAMEWAEENLSGDEYEAIFGEVPEDDSTSVLSARISTSTIEKLKRFQSVSGEKMGSIVEKAIENYIK